MCVGGHTIGTTACFFITNRLYNFNGSGGADPTINPSLVPQLRSSCPQNGDGLNRVALDVGSQNKFDSSYFINLMKGQGILQSDQVLWSDASTKPFVQKYFGGLIFNVEFGKAMVKMSNIEVKTGNNGEIRKKCSVFN